MSSRIKSFFHYLVLSIVCLIHTSAASAQVLTNPVASNVSNFLIQNIAGRSQILPLIGSDMDGTIVSFKILTLPNALAGHLYLNNILVTSNQVLTPTQAKQLQFEVISSYTGNATFTYTVTDNDGLTDVSPATFTIPVTNNGSLLVCTGGGLGTNILGAAGTFSQPYITPNTTVSCINNNSSVASPLQNLGNSKPALTSYNYASTSGGLGPEGTYSFLKTLGTMAVRNCIKTDWVASDHTGDGGYAMIVNGSPNSSSFGKTFYQATSMTVCPNTLYEFSAYVINVLPGNHGAAAAGSEPNISFYINNQLVSTSGSIAYSNASTAFVPQWVKVGGLWYSGPNTSVDLRIDNATFVASGNDLGLDDISLAICGPEINFPDISLTPKFCSYGVLPLNAEVKASINTYSSYIFQISTNGGSSWTDMGMPKTGSPVYDSGSGSYIYTAVYGDIPIDPSMNGYRYRLKVATDVTNLSGTSCNISSDKIIIVSAFDKPVAGADIISCNAISNAALVAAQSGEVWSASVSNPASAIINQSGQVSGMTINGIYEFYLSNTAGCVDTVKIIRSEIKTAGNDAVVCSDQTFYKFADAPSGYEWRIVSGNPSSAAIDPNTGYVSNLGVNGDYQFQLVSTIAPCADIVKLTKGICPKVGFRTSSSAFPEKAGIVTVEVFLDQASSLDVTAPYTLGLGTATNTTDFTTTTGNLNFSAGETSKLINVNLIDDNIIEPDETVVFNLGTPVNSSLGIISQHILTILNDDAAICISPDTAVHNEGNPGVLSSTDFTFKVSRTAGSYTGNTIHFTYQLSSLAAGFNANDMLDGTDLDKVISGSIPSGQNSVILTYAIKTDIVEENDDPFKVAILNADNGIMINCAEAQGTVLNDDLNKVIIQFETISTQTIERNVNLLLKVILSEPSPKAIDVTFDLNDISTTNDVDYINIPLASRIIHFNQNDTEAYITISVKEDTDDEVDESLKVIIQDPADIQFILGLQITHIITILDDDPLIVQDDHFSTNEETPFSNTVKANDYDPGGDPLTFTILTNTQHGQLIFNPDGTFSYTPDPNYAGVDSFVYNACNINNIPSCGNATVYLNVTAVNDPPVANADTFNGFEDSVISGTVILNDSDPDGDALTYTRLTNPSNGVLIFNANGGFTYTPNTNFNGTDKFTYQACDPAGLCDVAEVTLVVSPVNDPPLAANDNYTISECQSFSGSVAVNDTDPDNTAAELSYSLTGTYDTTKGIVTISQEGSFSFIPDGRFSGSLQVHYRVTDPHGLFSDGILTIEQPNPLLTVSLAGKSNVKCFGDNSGSIILLVSGGASPYSYAWSNGASTKNITGLISGSYTVVVTDANGCTAGTIINISQPPALAIAETHTDVKCFGAATGKIDVAISGGTAPYSYIWSNGSVASGLSGLLAGNYSVTVTDANGCTAIKSISVSQPAAALSIIESHENVKCFGAASGKIDLTVSGGTAPYSYSWNNGSVASGLSGLLAGNYNVTVTDANGCIAVKSISVSQPVAALSLAEAHENIKCFGAADGKIDLTISGGTAPYSYSWSNGSVVASLSGLLAGNYSVTVTDANGCIAVKSISVSQPVAALSIIEAHENIKCFGAAEGKIDLTVSGGIAPYSYSWSNGSVAPSLSGLFAGNYIVTVTDVNGCTAIKEIQISQPQLLNATLKISNTTCRNSSDGNINITVTGGVGPYSFSWNNNPALNEQSISVLSAGLYKVIITDKNGCILQLDAEVLPGNCTPVATNDEFRSPENAEIKNSVATNDTEPDGGKLIFTIISNPDHGKFIFNSGGSFIFTPDSGWNGTTTFNYTVCDSAGLCSASIATIIVSPVNDPPVAINDAYQTQEDIPLQIQAPGILVNDIDPDGDKISSLLKDKTRRGSVSLNSDGSFIYTPDQNFIGEDQFTYIANDGLLNSNMATVTIKVISANDPPVAVDDKFTTSEDIPVTGNISLNDSDPDGDPLTFTRISAPAHGKVGLNSNGTFTYIPNANFYGTDKFIYTACDSSGSCDQAEVTLIVNPVNDPPVAVNDIYQSVEGITLVIKDNTILINDYDPDADKFTAILQSKPLHGSLTLNPDGTFTYIPDKNFYGEDHFTYFTNDSRLNSNIATVTIDVTRSSTPAAIATVNLTPARSQIDEGDTASVTAELTSKLPADLTITLTFGGTAINASTSEGSDYHLTGDFIKIRIPAGQLKTTEKFNVEALPDNLREGDEFVDAHITTVSSSNVVIGSDAQVVIKDIYPPKVVVKNEPPPNPDILPDPFISPNGDDKGNEKFIIANISLYPDNEVLIFNRWGNEVFRMSGYNNEYNVFRGRANRGILTNTNVDLVDGVYYYMIYSMAGKERRLNKGYIILKR